MADAALVGVEVRERTEIRAEPVAARGLDLHDVGAEIGENLAAPRGGHATANLDHPDVAQCLPHRSPAPSLASRCLRALSRSRRSAPPSMPQLDGGSSAGYTLVPEDRRDSDAGSERRFGGWNRGRVGRRRGSQGARGHPGGHVDPGGPLVLQIEIVENTATPASLVPMGPDIVRLRVGGKVLAELDGRYLSTEVRGGFTGRVLGMYAVGRDATFDWFDYQEAGRGAPTGDIEEKVRWAQAHASFIAPADPIGEVGAPAP